MAFCIPGIIRRQRLLISHLTDMVRGGYYWRMENKLNSIEQSNIEKEIKFNRELTLEEIFKCPEGSKFINSFGWAHTDLELEKKDGYLVGKYSFLGNETHEWETPKDIKIPLESVEQLYEDLPSEFRNTPNPHAEDKDLAKKKSINGTHHIMRVRSFDEKAFCLD